MILQQTRVTQGLPYYLRFIERYPCVKALASASEQEILKLWQGLGYYSRARNMLASARYVSTELHGEFPSSYKELRLLKGVGDYTASAIASIAFNEPVAVVDGNVYRVLARYFGIDTAINVSQGVSQFKELANRLLSVHQPGLHNQAIMDFGAIQCKPKGTDCLPCPMKNSCQAFQLGKVAYLPVKIQKTKIKTLYFNYLFFIDSQQHTQLRLREKGLWQGLYEFPLWECEKTATLQEVQRFVEKDFTIKSIQKCNAQPILHKLTHRHIKATFWCIRVEELKQGILVQEVSRLPMSVLMANFWKNFSF